MFKEVLHNAISNVEGALGAMVMGMDGIAVEKVWQVETGQAANLEIAIAEFTSLLRSARRTNSDLGLGKLRQMTVAAENAVFILHAAGKDYFLALVLSPEGNFGRGRYEMRRAELLLLDELII